MGADETRIPISKTTRHELRLLKAKKDSSSYDELLRELVDERDSRRS